MARSAQYGPSPVPDENGAPIPGAVVTITASGGAAAALTSDISGATLTGGATAAADGAGMLTFYAPSGSYVLSWSTPQGGTLTANVSIQAALADPAEFVSDDATKGIVLKDSNGHYWRGTVNTSGVLAFADLGTTRPGA